MRLSLAALFLLLSACAHGSNSASAEQALQCSSNGPTVSCTGSNLSEAIQLDYSNLYPPQDVLEVVVTNDTSLGTCLDFHLILDQYVTYCGKQVNAQKQLE